MCLREKIGPDPRNFNQRVSLGRNDLLIRTFPKTAHFLENLAIVDFTFIYVILQSTVWNHTLFVMAKETLLDPVFAVAAIFTALCMQTAGVHS